MTNLDELLLQAEAQQQQLKLRLQFKKNMELFKQFASQIYYEYRHYKPKDLRLYYDEKGYLNLQNTKTGNPVYNLDPALFCQQQVEQYCQRPLHFKVGFNAPTEPYFFQLPMVSRIIDKFGPAIQAFNSTAKQPIGVMVINGCGIGYHIGQLLEELDIYNLCIFDPHKDSFYYSLYTIDWEPILKYFFRKGRLLKLFIGMSDDNTIRSLRMMTNVVGLHNISNTFIYNHLSSDKTDYFRETLAKQFHLTLTGTGFFEDEQVSTAHTIENINSGIAVLNARSSLEKLPPAIIVGNGPSLDGLLDKLRELKDDTVIFSCGTTTGTLYRHGIVPDFHVEMERIGSTTQRIRGSLDASYREQVKLLALNTVAPETMALFPWRYMAKKPNDPGEYIIDREFGEKMPFLNLCNPTCTNTGLAYALHMGFKEIYLFGVDLGMVDEEKHHASDSHYYDEQNKPLFASSEKRVKIIRPGNLGGEVKTTATMDTSRANMEYALSLAKNVRVYNPNGGALIAGAEPVQFDSIRPSLGLKDEHLIQRLVEHHFTPPPAGAGRLDSQQAKKKYLKGTLALRKKLRLPKNPNDITQVQQNLDSVLALINEQREKDHMAYWLLSGSVQSFFTLVLKASLVAKDLQELRYNYNFCRQVYHEFLERAYELIEGDCLKQHDIDADYSHLARVD